jgi:hypothetical protein
MPSSSMSKVIIVLTPYLMCWALGHSAGVTRNPKNNAASSSIKQIVIGTATNTNQYAQTRVPKAESVYAHSLRRSDDGTVYVVPLSKSSSFGMAITEFNTAAQLVNTTNNTQALEHYVQALHLFHKTFTDVGLAVDGAIPLSIPVIIFNAVRGIIIPILQQFQRSLMQLQAQKKSYEELIQKFRHTLNNYDQIILSLKPDFDRNWQAVYDNYVKERNNITFNLYSQAVITFTQQADYKAPYDKKVLTAEDYFNNARSAWSTNLHSISYPSPEDARTALYTSMSSLYFDAAHFMLDQARSPDKKVINMAASFYQKAGSLLTELKNPLGATYQQWHDQLTKAVKLLDTLTKTSSITQQISFYNQISSDLRAGSALTLADHYDRLSKVAQGDVLLKEGQASLKNSSESSLTPYVIKIAHLTFDQDDMQFFVRFFNQLSQALKSARSSYTAALTLYNQALEPSLKSSNLLDAPTTHHTRTNISTITSASDTLSSFESGVDDFIIVLKQLSENNNQQNVTDIISHAHQAVSLLTVLDKNLNNPLTIIGRQLPSATPTTTTYAILAQQILATLYIRNSSLLKPEQQELISSYYLGAYSYKAALSPDAARTVQQLVEGGDMLSQAQKLFASARMATDWTPSESDSTSSSSAEQSWNNALAASATCYASWKHTQAASLHETLQLYLNVIQEYADACAKNIPAHYQPHLRAALIRYRAYLVYRAENNTIQAELVKNSIEEDMTSFFKGAETLSTTIIPQTDDDYSHAISTQQQLLAWQQDYTHALKIQEQIIEDQHSAIGTNAPLPVLLQTVLKATTTQTYACGPDFTTPTITLSTNTISLANVYKEQGDYFKNKKEHSKARDAYKNAFDIYVNQQQRDNFNPSLSDLYARETTLAHADSVYQAVKTIGPDTTTYPGFTAYASYFLSVYLQAIPSDFPLDQSLLDAWAQLPALSAQDICSQLQHNTDLTNKLITTAMALDFYTALASNALLSAMKDKNYYDVLLNPKQVFPDERIQAYLQDSRLYGKKLQESIIKGSPLDPSLTTCITLYTPEQHNRYLLSFNKFITTIPEISSGKAWQNTALTEYAAAEQFYQQAGDQAMAQTMKNLQSNAYLSHSYSLNKKIDYVRSSQNETPLITTLISDDDERKLIEDMRLQFNKPLPADLSDDLTNALHIIQLYYGALISDLDAAAEGSTNNSKNLITTFTGQTYETVGDFLSRYLIGNPTHNHYQSYVTTINSNYLLAQGAYALSQQDGVKRIGKKILELYETIGDTCVQQALYEAAPGYYKAAEDACTTMKNNQDLDSSATKSIKDRLTIKGIKAYTRAAVQRFVTYQQARSRGITITSEDGSQQILSYTNLLKKYQDAMTGAANISNSELNAYNDVNAAILDSLIYLSVVQLHKAPELYQDNNQTDTLINNADQLIATYLQKQHVLPQGTEIKNFILDNTSFQAVSSQDLQSLIQDGYTRLIDQLLQNNIPAGEHDTTVAALIKWTETWYDALTTRYMIDYLGGEQPQDQLSDLITALKAEANSLTSPASQYLGSFQE